MEGSFFFCLVVNAGLPFQTDSQSVREAGSEKGCSDREK